MTVELEEFTRWRGSAEERLGRLETASDTHGAKISDHRGMLTAMDKDVSDAQAAFRAQLAVLNSVRETQSEQTAMLRKHTTLLGEHATALTGLRTGQQELREELTEVRVGIRTIIDLLGSPGVCLSRE